MIVSLEAIFLSTFVMISQNRADAKRQVIADQQWQTVKEEDRQNEELLELSRQILDLAEGDSTPKRLAAAGLDRASSAARRGTYRRRAPWQRGTAPWQRPGIDAVQVRGANVSPERR
jgi:uncharacterized membrane protein